ncbi:AbrB/MazE/SpoVT family DNA-binding domain-containing protein [Rhizobium sp. RAF56]|jgi:antitoxin MazE|uniref:AbrB/MazE/SpoVT family DNA-binding domain-containing protein n=1 Tax=Rhizobium sp. RAF56 TaxID=3233062 RepID=UPI003F9BE259
MMKATVSRWGNSIAIRLPKSVTEAMHLREGDVVDISVDNGRGSFEKQGIRLAPPLDEMIAEMDRLGWENEPATVDWGPDVGSERVYDRE